ncbi:hypothetical protein LMG28727_06971 [Paraburkholderia kirstenboschensis]|uniref:hypothetical protein n=1 Tax=Paraburkholderia kirstenboschensis TaxID=1245436 RepID=UPI00191887E9|nr:hypothetical protein [Paraburkholderia kirstenboschensis]CAD6559890.1 hypothetical protein LMG28727_06971 [Paraburkholderia kirstenboschensis]
MSGLTLAPLPNEVRVLIDSARESTAAAVNAELPLLYWQIELLELDKSGLHVAE